MLFKEIGLSRANFHCARSSSSHSLGRSPSSPEFACVRACSVTLDAFSEVSKRKVNSHKTECAADEREQEK